jgi:hypothetical protein
MSNIKQLHIGSPCADIIGLCITPTFISALTHLSLRTITQDTISPYEIILRYGAKLQSLRVEGQLQAPCSQYFRRYAHALPCLTDFGLSHFGTQSLPDIDFFPAVWDFLRPKASQLVRLELRTPASNDAQDNLGLDGGKAFWDMFKNTAPRSIAVAGAVSFPRLKYLSITLPTGHMNLSLHYASLIPRSVTNLSLMGGQLCNKAANKVFQVVSLSLPAYHFSKHLMSRQPRTKKLTHSWPPNLRFLSLDVGAGGFGTPDPKLVQTVAQCIATLEILRIDAGLRRFSGFWSFSRNETGDITRCRPWASREAEIMTEEMFDQYGCQDYSFED